MMNVPFTRSGCYKQSNPLNMPPHLQKPWHYKKIYQSSTTSKWHERFNSTVPMVPSETNTSATTIWQMLKRLLSQGQVSIRWIEQNESVPQQGTQNTDKDYVIASDTDSIYLNLGPLVQGVFKGERRLLKGLCRSLIRCVRWNLKSILRVLMKRSPTMSTLMNKR